jgi:hypothetical protein
MAAKATGIDITRPRLANNRLLTLSISVETTIPLAVVSLGLVLSQLRGNSAQAVSIIGPKSSTPVNASHLTNGQAPA